MEMAQKGERMMTIQEMKMRKKALGYSNQKLSVLSGVPSSTIQKILGGTTASPRYDTLQRLEAALQEIGNADPQQHRPESMSCGIAEPSASYGKKRQKEYTLEDYYALPDEQRAELIDGVLYDMASPSTVHQELIGILHLQMAGYVRDRKGFCKVMVSPFDVQLDMDNRTMVQPDLLVICDRSKIRRNCCFGAPDMVIEILSPSTRRKDLILKTQKYNTAGVREYWILDPDNRQVIVYDFDHDRYPVIYGFTDHIPVGIWDGELEIDFSAVSEEIAYLYEEET